MTGPDGPERETVAGPEGRLERIRSALRPPDRSREWFTIVGGVGILVFAIIGVFGPTLAPYPGERLVGEPFQPPSGDHLLGTDDVGHDILSILLIGARASLFVGLLAGTVATVLGTVVGVTAGVLGGRVETVLMRLVDVVLTIPFLPLLIVVAAVLGPGLWTTIGILAAVMWARPARELRSEILSVREREYIDAARAMGASALHIGARYVLPAVLLIVIAQFARVVSMAILLEAALSFLGLGDPTRHSWGTILFWAQQRSAFLTDAWKWWVIPPGLAITLSVLSFIFVALGLERRSGADRRSIATDVPGAEIDIVHGGTAPNGPDGDVAADGGVGTDGETGTGPPPALTVSDLTVEYGDTVAVDGAGLTLRRDETLGVVGESGSGKSSFALALLDLLRSPGRVTDGRVTLYTDRAYDDDIRLTDVRGDAISFVPQEAMNALNPRVRLVGQVAEAVRTHRDCDREVAESRARETLESVGLPPESHDRYPFELSGGMRQRGVIAMALVNDPSVLVVDEPTTGLDMMTTVALLELLEEIRAERALATVVISHDLATVTRVADRVAVMQAGRFVEVGPTARLRSAPDHPYTRELLDARTPMPTPTAGDAGASGDAVEPHLVYDGVSKSFGDETVLDGVDLTVGRGRSVALLGESGAGKSTLGRMALGLVAPDAGSVSVDGDAVGAWRSRDRRGLGRAAHYVFQDPYSSLAPNRPVERVVAEPLDIHDVGTDAERVDRVHRALADVGLTPTDEYAGRYPSELSGGERQRVAFARALVHEPSLLVADEPTSMLDAPCQRELLELLYDLVDDRGITLLHITHDIAQAATFAEELAVLHDGRIVERAPVASMLRSPEHEATRTLVEAATALSAGGTAPSPDVGGGRPAADGGDEG